jgi:membrane associated rhomboid family serine protease
LLGTWSGRILLVNAAFFFYLCFRSGSIFMPDNESLLFLGVKDPVSLAQGQIWRLVAPMFIHIGIIHFAVNSFALYVISQQLEKILGGPWYLLIYMLSGISGNIASAVFSLYPSAGASGAIFGLLGSGFFLEYTIGNKVQALTGEKPRNRVYAMTILINLAFGFLVPFVDNSAHLGGLVMGTGLTFAMVNIRPNRLSAQHQTQGYLAIVLLLIACSVGAFLGTSKTYLLARMIRSGDKASESSDKLFFYSQAIELDSENADLRLKRARLLFFSGEPKAALFDVRIALADSQAVAKVQELAAEIENAGMATEAWQIKRLVAYQKANQKS